MVSYGDNANAQRMAFGSVNSSLDAKTESFREVATTVVNAKLNRENDIETPSDNIHRITNLLTAAFLTTSPGKQEESPLWEMAQKLLEEWRGDDPDDNPWRINIPVERFRGLSSIDEIRPYNFVS